MSFSGAGVMARKKLDSGTTPQIAVRTDLETRVGFQEAVREMGDEVRNAQNSVLQPGQLVEYWLAWFQRLPLGERIAHARSCRAAFAQHVVAMEAGRASRKEMPGKPTVASYPLHRGPAKADDAAVVAEKHPARSRRK